MIRAFWSAEDISYTMTSLSMSNYWQSYLFHLLFTPWLVKIFAIVYLLGFRWSFCKYFCRHLFNNYQNAVYLVAKTKWISRKCRKKCILQAYCKGVDRLLSPNSERDCIMPWAVKFIFKPVHRSLSLDINLIDFHSDKHRVSRYKSEITSFWIWSL